MCNMAKTMPRRLIFLLCAIVTVFSLAGHVIADAVCFSPDAASVRQCNFDWRGNRAGGTSPICGLHTLTLAPLVATLVIPLTLTAPVAASKPSAFSQFPSRLFQPPKHLTIA